jgi:glycosyltransferase-like protein
MNVHRSTMRPRIALTTYSVKPRGGVVHTLELAEALAAKGADVTVVAMGNPAEGFFRTVDVPAVLIPPPPWADTLEERVFSWIAAMTTGLTAIGGTFDIVHSQDCISARAAAPVRDAGARFHLLRTVHHVDDFTTQALIDCQRQAIHEPDKVLVVSRLWQRLLAEEYGVDAEVVTNGVRADRFAAPISAGTYASLRQRAQATQRPLILTIGGIEPRKGSEFLVRAMGELRTACSPPPVLAVIGGHSFQDYRQYRERVLASVAELGLVLGEDVVLLGTVPDDELAAWFHAADLFAFPSVTEGWGLVILEAMSAGLPVVASDIDVFREFLTDGRDAVLTTVGDPGSLARGIRSVLNDTSFAARLRARGPVLAGQYSWSKTADQHLAIYGSVANSP